MKRPAILILAVMVLVGVAAASTPTSLRFLAYWGRRTAEGFHSSNLENHTFISGGIRLRYVMEGTGEPVVLVHGGASGLEHNWLRTGLIDRLASAGFQVIAYDARGFGRSEKPHDPARYGPEDVRDIVRLLDHLGLDRAHLVGYSRGAMLAHHASDRYPYRFRTLTLGGYGSDGSGTGPVEALSARELADSLDSGSIGPLIRALTPENASPPAARRIALANGLIAATNDMRALAASFRAPPLAPIPLENLQSRPLPMLAVVGEHDPFRAQVALMAEVVSALEVRVVPGADHLITPARAEFGDALVEFLTHHRSVD